MADRMGSREVMTAQINDVTDDDRHDACVTPTTVTVQYWCQPSLQLGLSSSE